MRVEETYPLILRHRQLVEGADFRAIIKLVAPVLVAREGDGWAFSGVRPAIFHTQADSRVAVMNSGPIEVTHLFSDLAQGETKDAFMERLKSVLAEIDAENEAAWRAALTFLRCEKAESETLPPEIQKLQMIPVADDLPFGFEVETVVVAERIETVAPGLPHPLLEGEAANNDLAKAA